MVNCVHRREYYDFSVDFDATISPFSNADLSLDSNDANGKYFWNCSFTTQPNSCTSAVLTNSVIITTTSAATSGTADFYTDKFNLNYLGEWAFTFHTSGYVPAFAVYFYTSANDYINNIIWQVDAQMDEEYINRILYSNKIPYNTQKISIHYFVSGDSTSKTAQFYGVMMEPAVKKYMPPHLGLDYLGCVRVHFDNDANWLLNYTVGGATDSELSNLYTSGVNTIFCSVNLDSCINTSGGVYTSLKANVVSNWHNFLNTAATSGMNIVANLLESGSSELTAIDDIPTRNGYKAAIYDFCTQSHNYVALKGWSTMYEPSALNSTDYIGIRDMLREYYIALKIADPYHPITVIDYIDSHITHNYARTPYLLDDNNAVGYGAEWQDKCLDFYSIYDVQSYSYAPLDTRNKRLFSHLNKPIVYTGTQADYSDMTSSATNADIKSQYIQGAIDGVECVAPNQNAALNNGIWFTSASTPVYTIPASPNIAVADYTDLLAPKNQSYYANHDQTIYLNTLTSATSGVGGAFTRANLEAKTWTPVWQDFKLSNDYVDLPTPIWAKYIKFEFDDLVPMPYTIWVDNLGHEEWIIQDYPYEAYQETQVVPSQTVNNTTSFSLSIQYPTDGLPIGKPLPLAPVSTDESNLKLVPYYGNTSFWESSTVVANSSTSITDAILSQQSNNFTGELINDPNKNYSPINSWLITQEQSGGAVGTRFTQISRHVYRETTVTPTQNIAYWVGLKEVKVYRKDYMTRKDDDKYIETFDDFANIESNEFAQDGCAVNGIYRLVVPTGRRIAQLETKAFQSFSNIEGVKILSNQRSFSDSSINTDTVDGNQVITNYNFSNSLVSWQGIDSSLIIDHLKSKDGLALKLVRNNSTSGGLSTSCSLTRGGRKRMRSRIYLDSYTKPWRINVKDTSGNIVYTNQFSDLTQTGRWLDLAHNFNMTSGALSPVETIQLDAAIETNSYNLRASLIDTYSLEFVQDVATDDVIYFDEFTLCDDTIVWEMSVDDGGNWYRIYDITNMVEGMVEFPQSGKDLKIRITALNKDDWISGFIVFPKYEGQ